MKNPGKSVVAALSFAGALGLTSCGGGSDASSNSPAGGTIFGPGTNPVFTSSTGTGTGPSGQPLLVRLGTDNLVQSDPPLNRKLWVAVVTDSATGHAVAGVTVQFTLVAGTTLNPGGFLKGFYDLPAPAPAPQVWTQSGPDAGPSPHFCPNEDVNHNGILDPLEDTNGSLLLEPPGVSSVNATGVSDATGFARATVSYPKNYATWAQVTLLATSGVGTPAEANFYLDGLASDYTNLTVSPPGAISPFGANNNCASVQ